MWSGQKKGREGDEKVEEERKTEEEEEKVISGNVRISIFPLLPYGG